MKYSTRVAKKIAWGYLLVFALALVWGCGQSNDVISDAWVQKRKYRKGYYVQSKKAGEKKNSDAAIALMEGQQTSPIVLDEQPSHLKLKKRKQDFFEEGRRVSYAAKDRMPVNPCDVIILKSGKEIKAKVKEVGISEVRYVMCDNLGGPVFVESKSKISRINYSNGTSTVLDDGGSTNKPDYVEPPSKAGPQPGLKSSSEPYSGTGTKSIVVAGILCFFLGLIGVHRFYLGYIGIGILQIITAGGCGIWTLIDFIRIVTEDLKPKDGSDYRDA